MNFKDCFSRAATFAVSVLLAASAYADVCVWRDPERTMQRLFPNARDYKSVIVKLTPQHIAAIEKVLGSKLDPTESREYNFYDITGVTGGRPSRLGMVMALAGKGEYGAIEVVLGLDPGNRIVGVYVQRAREKGRKALESEAFLKQFAGKTFGDDIRGELRPASPDTVAASRTIATVVHKMLIFHDVLR